MRKGVARNSIVENNSLHLVTIVLCAVLILGIYVGVSISEICLLLLIIRLLKCNKDTAGIFLLLFGGLLGGIIRQLYPFLPIYGLLVMGFGGVLLNKYLSSLFKNTVSIVLLFALFGIFVFAFTYGPMTVFAKDKLLYIIMFGIMKFYAFYCMCKSRTLSNGSIGELLVLLSILGITICLRLYGYQPPNDLLDFEWFRNGYGTYVRVNDEEPLIGYQVIGQNALYALAFFMTSVNCTKLTKLLSIIVCIVLTLISGARQSILGVVILFIAYYAMFKGENIAKKLKYIFLGSIVVVGILAVFSQLENSIVSGLFDTSQGNLYEQSSRELNFITAIILFEQNPLFGVGLGGYEVTGIGPYPHNFILEVLCECGIVGMCLIIFVLLIKLSTCRINIRYRLPNGSFYFLIILCLLIRSSVSEDLTESIGLFMSILAIPKH